MSPLKKIGFLFLFLFLPNFVYASDLTIEELTILNGEISPSFEPLNNEYTVSLAKEEYTIEMDYQVLDGITVSVMDNFDLENNSVVTLILTKEKEKIEYHLHILKEEEEKTLETFYEEKIEVKNDFMYTYKIYIIPTICLFLIGLVYKSLFHKHKK